MAIPAVPLVYSGQGYTAGGQVLADGVQPGSGASNIDASGTAVLDGALTTFAVQYIDGVQTIPFVPSAIQISVTGGTQPAAAFVSISAEAITNLGFTARVSGAGTNLNTLKFAARLVR